MTDKGLTLSDISLRDGLRLRVGTVGNGDPVLLIHGFTGCIQAWGPVILSTLAQAHKVIAVDLLGHGASDKPSDSRRYALQKMIEDLESVLDAFGIRSAAWIGYSMGGRVALGAAIERPDRVGSLILESASPGLNSEAERIERRSADASLAQRILNRGMEEFVGYWTDLPLFASQKRLPDRTRRAIRERRMQNSREGLAACLKGLGTGSQPCFWNRLHEIQVPTLFISGKEDSKFAATASKMRKLVSDASVCVVEQTGHTIHLERPEEWLRVVKNHLSE